MDPGQGWVLGMDGPSWILGLVGPRAGMGPRNGWAPMALGMDGPWAGMSSRLEWALDIDVPMNSRDGWALGKDEPSAWPWVWMGLHGPSGCMGPGQGYVFCMDGA